jgi:glyoxylase-like metal-dependent hydrolase (beta-lactamase superfamily II)
MEVKVIKSGLLQTNTYIVSIENNCIIIDPAFAKDSVIEYVKNKDLRVLAILLTHGHFDHIDSCNALARLYDCKVYIGRGDVNSVIDSTLNGGKKYLRADTSVDKKYLVAFDKEIILKLDNFMIDVMFTPGHSKGSCCYLIGNQLFSGDTLFRAGIGRVDLPDSAPELMDSSLRYLFTLKNEVVVFPGHGDETTIEKERKRYI